MCSDVIIRRKRRWSLVRIFVSLLPELVWKYLLPRPKRIHFNQNVNFMLGNVKCNVCQLSNSPANFNHFKSYLNGKSKTSELNLNSTPKAEVKQDARITDIQKELQHLKDQVAKILRQQQEKLQLSDCIRLNNVLPSGESISKEERKPPATGCGPGGRPPPPPPPMPEFLITGRGTSQKVQRPKRETAPPVKGFPCGKELLRDLRSVQLKKVQKSPGGGPLKKEKAFPQDPGNFLEEVLKKRFNHIQDVSSDASPDNTGDATDSFNGDDVFEKSLRKIKKTIPTKS